MKKLVNKNIINYLIVFIIPIAIFSICLAINKITPFGDFLITRYDSKLQYPAFFIGLKNFHFFSMNLGFGFNFLGTFLYYLVNPLNQLIHFFDIYKYTTFYYLLISIKLGLCSTSFLFFIKRAFKNYNNTFAITFSIIYALIGFSSSYYYNVFWLDGMIFMPLVLHGINKIINGSSPLFYIITLSLSIIFCFYTGYMSCIFSLIYFIYKLIDEKKYKNKKIIITFIISSILVGLISCLVLVPSFFTLISGKASGYSDKSYTKYLQFNPNIKFLFYSFTPGNFESSQVPEGFAQNFCTLFVISMFFLSFFNKKIPKRTKITALCIFLFFCLSYSFNLIDFAWQFFQKPVWWQHRYSWCFSLFMMIIAYKNLSNFQNISIPIKTITFSILSGLTIISFILIYFYHPNSIKLPFYKVIILIFSILLLLNYIYLFTPKYKLNKIIVISFIFIELFTNTFVNIKENNNKSLLSIDNGVKESVSKSIDYIRKKDNSFFRMENTDTYSSNDGLLFGYNGINYFNSLRNQNIVDLAEYYLNFEVDSHCSITLKTLDPYILSLFNIKYINSAQSLHYLNLIHPNIYQNNYPLALGFMVNEAIKDVKLNKNDYESNISNIFSSMTNKEYDLYHEIENKSITLENAVYNEKDNIYQKIDPKKEAYINIDFKASENIFIIPTFKYIKTNGELFINETKMPFNESYPYIKKDEEVRVRYLFAADRISPQDLSIRYLKEQNYIEIMEQLDDNILENIQVNTKHTLQASINIENEEDILFTTIPYEKGMTIKVNGQKVKPEILLNTFIGLKLHKGENIITIDYIPQGLIFGIIISLCGIILTFIYSKYYLNIARKK